jgi:CRISPR-associated protein Cas5d
MIFWTHSSHGAKRVENRVQFAVSGRYALFTDPLTKIGGEKCSYRLPTYEALKGILGSVYWKPTIVWFIDRMRVLRLIRTQTWSAKPLDFGGGNSLAVYTYLADVEYQVQAHFEWNLQRPDLSRDRDENKHYFVARRMIERGGRRDVFLGTRECQAYVEPCVFGEGSGFYDNAGEMSFDLMFHGFDYPDESTRKEFRSRFWKPTMINGVVEFIRPEACTVRKFIRPMQANPPRSRGLVDESLWEGLE